jgi:hypothetical protein
LQQLLGAERARERERSDPGRERGSSGAIGPSETGRRSRKTNASTINAPHAQPAACSTRSEGSNVKTTVAAATAIGSVTASMWSGSSVSGSAAAVASSSTHASSRRSTDIGSAIDPAAQG